MDRDCLHFYATFGWPLFPCSAQSKAPLVVHGFKDATLDLRQLGAWHEQYPECAWGTPTSAERGVIDIDPRNGGAESLARLERQHGPIPPTPKVRTGGNGYHYWLRFPAGTPSGKVADGIDRKAEGGYVIVPPSRITIADHQGRAYVWEVRPWETAIAEAPAWCLSQQSQPHGLPKAESNPWIVRPAGDDLLTHPGSPEGQRRVTLCGLVGIHLARGDSDSTVYAAVEAWAARCQPPFAEWRKHVDGLMRREQAKAEKMTTPVASPPYTVGIAVMEDRSDCLTLGREGNNSANGEGELVCSLPVSAESGEASGLSAHWPRLSADAEYGLLGEMLRTVKTETEADPAGILLGWLTCFGSVIGRGAWVQVGARRHHPALFVGIAGRTSDAKGDGWAVSLWPFREVEPGWAGTCMANGVGSGEGLLERVADEQLVIDSEGVAKVIPGSTAKGCLVRLSELSRCFKLGRRENATLSEYLREAWDGEPIHLPNRKKTGNALSASDYAVSLFGDITPGVLRKLLDGGTEAFDGFANRFLWAAVRSPRCLPDGGSMEPLRPHLEQLAEALAFAKQAGEVRRDADAEALWAEVYPTLKTSGDSVPHTDRARPYAVRLSLCYALADQSKVIRPEHLRAALAVWEYCRASARLLFGGAGGHSRGSGLGSGPADPLWLQILNAILRSAGISRTDLREVAGHKTPAGEIDAALALLERSGHAYKRMVQPEGGGRPAERWYPIVGPVGDGDGENVSVDNPVSPLTEPASPEAGREGTNSASGEAQGGEETLGREQTPAFRPEGSLFPPSPMPEADTREAEAREQEAAGVVSRPAQADFSHQADGSFGVTGEPQPDHWPPTGFTLRREPDGGLLALPAYSADNPPEPKPERKPGESDGDYFLRCLEE